jgi:alkaline phosphatase
MGRRISFGTMILVLLLWAGGAQAGPKNIILLIGDGMGPEQVAAGRLLAPGGELVMDQMPVTGSVVTTNVYEEITDSAASATAYATGCKTANGNISMAEDDETVLPTNMELAMDPEVGMATGILSSVYLCDATPGVWVAHAPRRSCSTIIPFQIDACPDVFLGPRGTEYVRGGRGKNSFDLVAEFVESCNYEEVTNAAELAAAQAPNDRLIGMWPGYSMYEIDRQNDPGSNVPTLAEMTAKAIEVLKRDPDGFFLVVEGGGIDWMAHNRDIAGTARDVVAFDDAVAVAYDFATSDDGLEEGGTLVVVTADHETGGLQVGGNPTVAFIEGITASTDFMYGRVARGEMTAEEVLETYAGVDWNDLTPAEKQGIADYGEMGISDVLTTRANVTWGWSGRDEGSHTATQVPVFAFGPGSDPFDGSIDNTDIGKLIFNLVSGSAAPSCPLVGE